MEEAFSNIDNEKDKNLFWKVLRGNRRTKMLDSAPSLKEWDNYFSKLLTLHNSNSVVLQLDEKLKNFSTDYMISEEILCKAIKTLKAQSAKDHDGVLSNHFQLAPSSFLITLLAIFNYWHYSTGIFTTGLVPSSFYIGIVTLIPNSGKKDLSSCSSWRPLQGVL